MLTNEEANRLIAIDKMVVQSDDLVAHVALELSNGRARYALSAEDSSEADCNFLLDINQSRKNHLKLTLHFQEDDAKIGLLRLDYAGQHRNPTEALPGLPDRFKQYAGAWFGYDTPHMHYYVEGYAPLVWAIPLADDAFALKVVSGVNDVLDVTREFSRKINLKTRFGGYQDELA